jgi:hypothetical protein
MTKNKLLNMFVFISFILITSLQVQPTFAMEKQEYKGNHECNIYCKYSFITTINDTFDELHGIDLYLPMQQQSVSCNSQDQSETYWDDICDFSDVIFYRCLDVTVQLLTYIANHPTYFFP